MSESCKGELVDALNNKAYTVNGVDYTAVSMRAYEAKRREGSDGTIAVEFTGSSITHKHISDLLAEVNDDDLGRYHIFGQEMTETVQITIRCKEVTIKGTKINPRFFTEAILKMVIFRIRKYWNSILAGYRGSVDNSRGWVLRDLTPYIRSEMASERFIRIWIRYIDVWALVEPDLDEQYGLPSRGVTIDAKSDYNEQDWEYALVLAEV